MKSIATSPTRPQPQDVGSYLEEDLLSSFEVNGGHNIRCKRLAEEIESVPFGAVSSQAEKRARTMLAVPEQ